MFWKKNSPLKSVFANSVGLPPLPDNLTVVFGTYSVLVALGQLASKWLHIVAPYRVARVVEPAVGANAGVRLTTRSVPDNTATRLSR